MRALGWICVGFFLYYAYDAGGLVEAVNKISGEIYHNTSTSPADLYEESVRDLERALDDLRN